MKIGRNAYWNSRMLSCSFAVASFYQVVVLISCLYPHTFPVSETCVHFTGSLVSKIVSEKLYDCLQQLTLYRNYYWTRWIEILIFDDFCFNLLTIWQFCEEWWEYLVTKIPKIIINFFYIENICSLTHLNNYSATEL